LLITLIKVFRNTGCYSDNEAAALYTHNNKKIKAAKHINIMFYVVKEKIQDQSITKMIADQLMKGLPPTVFREHLAGMCLRESL
jgi:hypothetical protein